METPSAQRRYELDWLRVLTVLTIFIFHSSRLFDTDDWLIKNPTTHRFVDVWKAFATSWGMPLLLIISGASAFYALGKVRPGKYVLGLTTRLLVPLVVGILTHAAVQVYVSKRQTGAFDGSFFEFYPHYFEGMDAFGGNFAWHGLHLWYLEILFVLSLLLLPLLAWLRCAELGQRALRGLGILLAMPGGISLLALPVVVLILVLDPDTWGTREMGGWSIFIYPCFFLSGFVIFSCIGVQRRILQARRFALAAGLVLSTCYLFLQFQSWNSTSPALWKGWEDVFLSLSSWSWLLTVLGFGMKYLHRNSPFLKYANEATLPFYILHQTAIISLGYFVVRWPLNDLLKFLLVLIASFLVSMGLYELLIRRVKLLRFLFGMKVIWSQSVPSTPDPCIPVTAPDS